jgi:effector-binding domain-containing protein
MKRKHKWWIISGMLAGGLVIMAASVGPIMSNVEQPKYTVAESYGEIEIRDYAPMIVAETEVTGTRELAISEGFRTIADYIFGNNINSRQIKMTAPVTQEASEPIAMTAPVTQRGDGDTWRVRFVMPSKHTMESLPLPKNPAVKIKQMPGRRFAAIRFSGLPNNGKLRKQTARLENLISAKKLSAISVPSYAFYNPPWTLPFLRRNEVLIEINMAPL